VAKKGPVIGTVSRNRRRTAHQHFKRSKRRLVGSFDRRVAPKTGFSRLFVQAHHDAGRRHLVLTVTGRRAETNRGPGLLLKKVLTPWPATNDGRASTKAALELLDKVETDLKARRYPDVGLFLGRCNTSGMDAGDFLESVCAECLCWYCELSDAQ
jgi:hypothetical protein